MKFLSNYYEGTITHPIENFIGTTEIPKLMSGDLLCIDQGEIEVISAVIEV